MNYQGLKRVGELTGLKQWLSECGNQAHSLIVKILHVKVISGCLKFFREHVVSTQSLNIGG